MDSGFPFAGFKFAAPGPFHVAGGSVDQPHLHADQRHIAPIDTVGAPRAEPNSSSEQAIDAELIENKFLIVRCGIEKRDAVDFSDAVVLGVGCWCLGCW